MAMTVSASIQLNDMMSSSIQHITSALNIMINCMERTDAAINTGFDSTKIYEMRQHIDTANAELAETAERLDNIRDKTDRAVNVTKNVANVYDNIEKNTKQAETAQKSYNASLSQAANNAERLGDNLLSSIKRYVAMIASLQGAKALMGQSDIWTSSSARLELITNSDFETDTLQKLLYNSAKSSRGNYADIVSNSAKLGLLAGDSFINNGEIVKFNELMNKSFKLSGASTQESTAAMYQLTQAMASGRLQGDEFRSIIENAPLLADAIAEYTGVGREGLKDLSSDGAISAEIIKNSLFSVADDIESKFSTLPMTFGDVWTNIVSDATMAFAPLYNQMNDMLNSDIAQSVIGTLPSIFESVSSKAQSLLFILQNAWTVAGPGLQNIFNAIKNIGSEFFSTGGIVSSIASTISVALANPAVVTAIYNVAGGISVAAGAFNSVLKIATPLLPQITGIYVAFKAYKTINSFVSPLVGTIGSLASGIAGMATQLKTAAIGQEALNTAMKANPYGMVASAVAKVISVMLGLIASIKAVNEAAGLATADDYSYENIKEINAIMDSEGVDRETAIQISDGWDSYRAALDSNAEARQEAYDKWFEDNYDTYKSIAFSGYYNDLSGDALKKAIISDARKTGKTSGLYDITQTYSKNATNLQNDWGVQRRSIIESYNAQAAADEVLNGISTNIDDYIKDYGNIFGNNTSGGLLDATDETAKNTEKIAKNTEKTYELMELVKDNLEREAIAKYTSQAKTVTYDLSGMQNTYNNARQNFNPVKEVERYLKKKATISAEGI